MELRRDKVQSLDLTQIKSKISLTFILASFIHIWSNIWDDRVGTSFPKFNKKENGLDGSIKTTYQQKISDAQEVHNGGYKSTTTATENIGISSHNNNSGSNGNNYQPII